MATISQERNLLLILSKNFMFFEWKFEECDIKIGNVLRSSEFEVGERESSFLEMTVNERSSIYLYLHNPKFVGGGYYLIAIFDSKKSEIFSALKSTTTFSERRTSDKVDLLESFGKLPASTIFPVFITCTAKSIDILNMSQIIHQSASQHRLNELSLDFKKMFDLSINPDVVLNVDGENINSHRAVLQARSPVFNRMLHHDSKETIDISDVRVSPMKKFVSFLYTGVMESCGFDEALELYYIADKYEVLSMREDCKIELLNNINTDNACSLFVVANQHSDKVFVEQVVQFICNNYESVVQTKEIDDMSKDDLKLLMRLCARALKK